MTNYVIIGDLHLDEYEGRLDKYLELADNLVDVCKIHNSSNIIFAGDTINKSVTTPAVLNTLSKILNKFKDNGIKVEYILGQHDYNLKHITNDLSHTYLGLMPMEYIGGTHRMVEGLDIHFRDYDRADLVVSDPCDILIAHVSLGFQSIDESKFKVCICGDIHKPMQMGKCFTTSPPLQIHPSEPEIGYYTLLTMDSGTFKHERRQLPTIFTLPKPIRIKEVERTVDTSSEVKIPQEIKDDIDLTDMPQPINMNFKLRTLNIVNFRGCKSRRIDFNHRVINIKGPNGSGKSTILWALYYAFVKSRESFDKLQVAFEYAGSEWLISRGDNRIFKDRQEILVKSKTDFENKLLELFPFIELLTFFNVYTYHHFFDCDRIALFEEVFNLKGYAYIANKTRDTRKKYEKQYQDLTIKSANLNGQITALEGEVQDIVLDRESISTRITEIKKWTDKLNVVKGMKTSTDSNIARLQANIDIELVDKDELEADRDLIYKRDNLVKSISRIKSNLIVCPNCGTKINAANIDELEMELANLATPKYQIPFINKQLSLHESRVQNIIDLTTLKADQEKINNRIIELESRIDEKELNDLTSQLAMYDANERIKEKIETFKTQLAELDTHGKDLLDKIDKCDELLIRVDIKNPQSEPVKKIKELTKLIETDDIKFSILSELKNGNEKLDIQVVYNGIDYDRCSHGEKCMLDLHLLRCITRSLGAVGFVILDESLCTLSPKNYELAGEIIEEISAHNVLVTSHAEGFNHFDTEIDLG